MLDYARTVRIVGTMNTTRDAGPFGIESLFGEGPQGSGPYEGPFEIEAFFADGHSSIADEGFGTIAAARSRARALYSDPDVQAVRILVGGGEVWGSVRP